MSDLSQNFKQSVKNEVRGTLTVGIPLIAAQLVYACSGFIGTAMIARLGEDALAASVLVSLIWFSMMTFFIGILNAVSVLVSHQFGAKNHLGISEIMGQSFILGAILTVIILALAMVMPWFLQFSTQPEAVLTLARQYMYALTWTVPGLVVLIILEQFLAGVNQPRLVLRISLLVVPIEIPLIYLLIFGKWGFPACGVAGVGYGFAISWAFVAICLTLYLIRSHRYRSFGIFKHIKHFQSSILQELVRVGLPMGFMHLIEVSTFSITTFWIARFGTTVLAAHQIVFQYLSMGITIVFAMSQAVTVRVGHAVGRKDVSNIRFAIYVGMLLNLACMIVIALAFNLFPEFFMRLDINIHDPANLPLIRQTAVLIGIAGILVLFDNCRIVGFGALRGLKDTKFPMYAALFSFWVIGLSAAYVFAFYLHWEGAGIWWGLTLGIACGALMVFCRLQWLLKQRYQDNEITWVS